MLFAVITLIATSPSPADARPAASGFVDATPLYGVEAVVDRGPVSDVVIRCAKGRAIVSFSKAEKVFCTPKGGCAADLSPIALRACGE